MGDYKTSLAASMGGCACTKTTSMGGRLNFQVPSPRPTHVLLEQPLHDFDMKSKI